MKKLGTLEVFLDEDDTVKSSELSHTRGDSKYQIVLRPKVDYGPIESVLAHELGHFIGKVFQHQVSLESGYPQSTTTDNLNEEKQAWKFAEEIKPGAFDRDAKKALATYQSLEKAYPHAPMFLLRLMGVVP